MIVSISCSSPVTSVALVSTSGKVLFSHGKETAQNASGAAIELLQQGLAQTARRLDEVELFVADIGPGSFIGARVGVTLAKSFAFSLGTKAAGVTAFDLVADDKTVFIPCRKGEFFVRVPGEQPTTHKTQDPRHLFEAEDGEIGYGRENAEQTYPNAANVASLLSKLQPMAPELLMPNYMIEPSISTPKPVASIKPK